MIEFRPALLPAMLALGRGYVHSGALRANTGRQDVPLATSACDKAHCSLLPSENEDVTPHLPLRRGR